MANQSLSGQGSSNGSAGSGNVGISSALDLLGKMENQVGSITHNRPKQAAASSAADEELRQLREELLSADQRGYEQLAAFVRTLEDLKLAIPSLIDESVNTRFLELEDSFHRNVKEIHSRSIDAFTQSVQSKIGQRISVLETNLSVHTEAMGQLREHYLKTDRNVQRLMSGLDRLTAELLRLSGGNSSPNLQRTIFAPPRQERADRPDRGERYDQRPLAQSAQQEPAFPASSRDSDSEPVEAPPQSQQVRKRNGRRRSLILVPVLALFVLVPVGLVVSSIRSGGGVSASRTRDAKAADVPLTGIPGQMRMAADFALEKDYVKAESTYRLILKSEPNDRDAIKELASVLFRQQRYEEAAAVLKTLPPE